MRTQKILTSSLGLLVRKLHKDIVMVDESSDDSTL